MTIPRALLLLAFAFLVAWMFPGGPRPEAGTNASSAPVPIELGAEPSVPSPDDPARSLLAETPTPAR